MHIELNADALNEGTLHARTYLESKGFAVSNLDIYETIARLTNFSSWAAFREALAESNEDKDLPGPLGEDPASAEPALDQRLLEAEKYFNMYDFDVNAIKIEYDDEWTWVNKHYCTRKVYLTIDDGPPEGVDEFEAIFHVEFDASGKVKVADASIEHNGERLGTLPLKYIYGQFTDTSDNIGTQRTTEFILSGESGHLAYLRLLSEPFKREARGDEYSEISAKLKAAYPDILKDPLQHGFGVRATIRDAMLAPHEKYCT